MTHEPFYDHRVPPYSCPSCAAGVLLLKRETLHIGETAESRRLCEAAGPEVGGGQWLFSCLFQCCDPDCTEVVSAVGTMSWTRDPRLPPDDSAIARGAVSGRLPDPGEQMLREQVQLVHRYQPVHFLPSVDVSGREGALDRVHVADDFVWMVVDGTRYEFETGRQADIIRVLYDVWLKGGREDGAGLTATTIRDQIGSAAQRLRVRTIFKDHAILGNGVLRSDRRGQWALHFTPTTTEETLTSR